MNRLVFSAEQVVAAASETVLRVRVSGRQLTHLHDVHRAQLGDSLRVGQLHGKLGQATVSELTTHYAELDVTLAEQPLPKAGITLLLALPRPKMLKRIVQMVTTLGIDELVLLNSYRVEKSYWQTPFLQAEALQEQLLLGLEQAGDTIPPTITLAQRFKPFVEDELPARVVGRQCFVAHPCESAVPCPSDINSPMLLAIGPEGGFIPYELAMLQAAGLQAISLGPRILRVETAVAVALGRMQRY